MIAVDKNLTCSTLVMIANCEINGGFDTERERVPMQVSAKKEESLLLLDHQVIFSPLSNE